MNRPAFASDLDAFQFMLKESVDRFLTDYRKGASDFSNFTSIFSRLLHILPDPPLEIVWFYASLTSFSTKLTTLHNSNQLSLVKDLFQLLVSCCSSCSTAKKIALLAPVICEIYGLVFVRRDLREEIEVVLEGVIGYISICCGACCHTSEEFEVLGSCFADMVRVWVVEKIGDNGKFGEDLRVFCPVISDGIRKQMVSRERFGVGDLAGVVMVEAFLLRLCLKFGCGISRAELKRELNTSAVQMMAAFRSYYFFDTLLRMLLEPVLPVVSLIKSDDAAYLQEILMEAVIMMDYSFFFPQKGIQIPDEHLKSLAVMWLLIADNAIQFVRETSAWNKVTLYGQAFFGSCVRYQLIKWVMDQPGLQGQRSLPNVSTPVALIKWLLNVEERGVRVFDCKILKIYAKAIICRSRADEELSAIFSEAQNLPENNLYYNGNVGKWKQGINYDLKMVDSMNVTFLDAPEPFKAGAANLTRKRKEGPLDEGDKQFKVVRSHLTDISVMEKVLSVTGDDNFSSVTEVDDPVSFENVEYMEQ
ncbi:hypothetical protein K2173_017262 [Erythroxylum novogranatense]|uniref:Uncharacterized protein n=1 Tax=Erythroxylum novogranatense TaxID=1862640 RepID=A0AAV8U692_9ROSI|nr:hypothetical protein K2173_017262 [Erythroxylum novogranatense]